MLMLLYNDCIQEKIAKPLFWMISPSIQQTKQNRHEIDPDAERGKQGQERKKNHRSTRKENIVQKQDHGRRVLFKVVEAGKI
jgi:hypothetical protein